MNASANFTAQAATLLVMFLCTPYILRGLGTELYGIFILLLAYIDLFALLDLGINATLVTYLAALLPEKRTDEINKYAGTALSLALLIGLLAIAATFTLPSVFAELIVPAGFPRMPGVRVVLLFTGLAFALRLLGQVFSAVLIAAQRLTWTSSIRLFSESLRLVGSVVVIQAGYALGGVAGVLALTALLTCVAHLLAARIIVPGLSIRPTISRQHLRSILSVSKFILLANVSGRVVHSLDKVLIAHLLSPSAVAFYAVAYSLGEKLWAIVGNVTAAVFPAAGHLKAIHAHASLQELYARSIKAVFILSYLPAAFLSLFAHEILSYWIGSDFAAFGSSTLQIFSLGFLVNCLAHIPYVVSLAAGHPEIPARFAGLNAVSNLTLFILLVPSFGTPGAASAFLTAQLVLTPWFIATVNRLLGISHLPLVRQSFLPVAVSALGPTALLFLARGHVSSISTLLLSGTVALLFFGLFLSVLALDPRERDFCRTVLRRLFRRSFQTGASHVS